MPFPPLLFFVALLARAVSGQKAHRILRNRTNGLEADRLCAATTQL
jgi:hypothetical protein